MAGNGEPGYCALVSRTIASGAKVPGRNGAVRSTYGASISYDLTDEKIPVFTTKKVAWKTCLRELLWFLEGGTDARVLDARGCKIWNANASRQFLDSRGLSAYPEGVLGPVYGWQWRAFNTPYDPQNRELPKSGIDQIGRVLRDISNPATRFSRRHVVSAWNPQQLDQMALPPCHVLFQLHVVPTETGKPDDLHCSMYQRSADLGLGVPFNVASYGFLTHIIARKLDLNPVALHHHLGDAHVYDCHIDALEQQLSRAPLCPPRLVQTWDVDRPLDELDVDDFRLEGYTPIQSIKMEMKA